MLTFIMLARLSTLCPNAVLQRLERLIEPLRATCSTKVRSESDALGVGSATCAVPVTASEQPRPTFLWSENPVPVPAGVFDFVPVSVPVLNPS